MAWEVNDNKISTVISDLCDEGFDGITGAVVTLLNEAMKLDRARHLQVAPYERSDDRQGYANGYKPKTVKSKHGELQLQVPQVRDSEEDFYPNCLEKGIRSERALKASLAEMYIQGVSTRKVKKITESLCGYEVSSSQVSRVTKELDEQFKLWRTRPIGKMVYLIFDARYEKVRHGGHVIDNAVLIGYGIDESGKKHVLGVSVSLSEAEVHWRNFFESLVKRGLHGTELIVSDAHSGLKAARRAVFPSIPWQRCQFHLQQNAQSYVPKLSMKKSVAKDIKDIFNAPNLNEAKRLLQLTVDKYRAKAPKLSDWMENNLIEGFNTFQFPEEHWIRLRTSNLAERINKEIKKRTRIVGIFPNCDSCLRLVTAMLVETDEDWSLQKPYLKMTAL
jgi:putative transposase|tara:strand:+ start:203 stop:1372 length:1170 start_codon:yes stop_codon:yes gene_type:complete